MKRTFVGGVIAGALLMASIGAALAHGSKPGAPLPMSQQCARFHTPKPEEKVTAADYARCARLFVEAAAVR
jgi:hypothetical protein